MAFRKPGFDKDHLKSIAITYQWLPVFFLKDHNLHSTFSTTQVVDNSRTQTCLLPLKSLFGNKPPAFAYTCTFYYHAYTHMISRDGWFYYVGTKFHTSHTTNSTLQNSVRFSSVCLIIGFVPWNSELQKQEIGSVHFLAIYMYIYIIVYIS